MNGEDMEEGLSPARSAALLDILSHYDTYGEIRDFRYPGSLKHYGPPFTSEAGKPSSTPALQALVAKFLLPLPGLRDLPDDFWKVRVHAIIDDLETANLSESYDKGVIGSRKTLATAVSALIEYPVRGVYGGMAKIDDAKETYDITNGNDLAHAFRIFINEAIYGTSLEEFVQKAGESDNLNDHLPLVKAVHEFVLVNLASFMHYTLVLSPKGQYLLKLVDNANKLVPYMVIKQTLKIGNVASMINAMMKVVLAKLSVTSLTNWMGITQSKDEGMNLMQQIISTVLNWDIRDLETRASKIERERAQLGKDQLHSLKSFTDKSREEQDQIRKQSRIENESISIVTAILKTTELEWQLTEFHHKQALDYLNIQLSIRDRKQIIQVLCHSHPDHLTQSVRDLVGAYEPVIRRMHEAIDLSGTLGDFEYFLKDMIKLAKVQTSGKTSSEAVIPTVGDFAQLLRKHQKAAHRFVHQLCKNGPELTGWYLDWAKRAAQEFRQSGAHASSSKASGDQAKAAGDLTAPLDSLFESLPSEIRRCMIPILDAHTKHIDEMHASSAARLDSVLRTAPSKNPSITKILQSSVSASTSSATPPSPTTASSPMSPTFKDPSSPTPKVTSDPGPGAYLARWQDLLDTTPITPLTQTGKVQTATSPEVVQGSAKDVNGQSLVEMGDEEAKGEKVGSLVDAREDVRMVVDELGSGFREILAKRGCCW